MKIKFTRIGMIVAVLLAVAVAVFSYKFINDVKDYKQTLAANRSASGQATGQDSAADRTDEKASTAEIESAKPDIAALMQAEQAEREEEEGLEAAADASDSGNSGTTSGASGSASDSVKKAKPARYEGSPSDVTLTPHANSDSVINVLFLGIDRTEARDETLGVYRTDTIMLSSINLDTKKVQTMCIPRDTYAYIPRIGRMDKINHAYVWGGMGYKGIQSTINTINRFIRYSTVDYYFAIDMEPIPEIVDGIGGVELDVEINMGKGLSKGKHLLNGSQALTYVTWRGGGSDIQRAKRQYKFCKAMVSQIKESKKYLQAVNIIMNYGKYIKTNMNLKQMLSFAELIMDVPASGTHYSIVPGNEATIDKVWYWVPDEAKLDGVLKGIF